MANKNKEIEDKQRSREAVTKGLLLIEIIPRNRPRIRMRNRPMIKNKKSERHKIPKAYSQKRDLI